MNKKHYLKPEMRIFEMRFENVICGTGSSSGGIGSGGNNGETPPPFGGASMPRYRTQLWN